MPFIGNQPALAYTSFAKQDFTTSATTSYTLDNPVANANEIALFINFVRQEPTTAYTASGTSLTLTSATSASDDMYCVFLGKAVQTVNPPSSSVGISQLSATGTKDSTTFLRGDNTFAEAGGGKVLQVIQANEQTSRTTTSTSFVSLTFNASITPSSISSKILVILSGTLSVIVSQGNAYINIDRNGTLLSSSTHGFTGAGIVGDFPTNTEKVPLHISYLDSPSTTSSVTYTLYGKAQSGKTCAVNNGGLYETSFILMEIGA